MNPLIFSPRLMLDHNLLLAPASDVQGCVHPIGGLHRAPTKDDLGLSWNVYVAGNLRGPPRSC